MNEKYRKYIYVGENVLLLDLILRPNEKSGKIETHYLEKIKYI